MCISKSPTVDTSYQDFAIAEADAARAEEAARQGRITDGMSQIAAVFDGGSYTAPGDTSSLSILDHMRGVVPEGVTTTYEGMQPVLDQRREAMEGFYLPQLNEQHRDARDDLTFALARAGQLTSSTAGERQADLSRDYALQRTSIEGDISADLAQTQSQMNAQRSALEAGLRSSGDATAASNSALATATTFRQDTPQLDSLGPIFSGLSQGIGAYQTGVQNGQIRQLATPSPLQGSGQIVR